MKEYYYAKTIRNNLIAFMDMFNDIQVARHDDNGIVTKSIEVPIFFAPMEKNRLIQLRENANLKSAWLSSPLPRIGVSFTALTYDSDRSTGKNETRQFYDEQLDIKDIDNFISDIQPTPYNFTYTLFLRTNSLSDCSQILEHILSYFNPSLYLRVKEFSFLNIERDLQVTADSSNIDFLQDQDNENLRYVNAQIDLTVKGFLYRPLRDQKIIHEIKTNYMIDDIVAENYTIDKEKNIVGETFM